MNVPDSAAEGDEATDFKVVGIGASAGGLESLERLFSALPDAPGMAFVVIQHLSPDFRSMMDELLSRHTAMPIRMAEHEVAVRPNHVYLLPPRKEMIIRGRRLLLTDKERGPTLTLPIDQFFRSLALDCGPDAIAIVLSGSGTDGSRGVRDVRNAGGLVLVETPETAQFDGMPASAVASGAATHVVPAGDMAAVLLAGRDPVARPAAAAPPDDSPMTAVLQLLRDHFDLDFSQYKTTTVSRRVLRRMEMRDEPNLEAYVDRLHTDASELGALYHDLLIGVTRFFRDPEAFAVLEKAIVPEILAHTAPDEEIRVWVAGCATGEEAYSIAMLFIEQLTAAQRPVNLKVLATDVHRLSLMHGSAGVYDEAQLEHVSAARRQRFFTPRGDRFAVVPELRQHIVFAPHNVTKDAPFTKMHLITCRNLLIYLEPAAQKTVLSLFHFGLTTGGALFLGSSESPGDLLPEFTPVDDHWKIYRKRRDVRLVGPEGLASHRRTGTRAAPPPRPVAADAHLLGVYDQLLDRWMPPSLLIDEDRRLVDCFGGAEQYLHLAPRRPSMNVLDLLDGDLKTMIGGAIQRALSRPGAARYDAVPISTDGGGRRATLTAEAFANPRTHSRFVLMTLQEDAPSSAATSSATTASGVTAAEFTTERMQSLEADLSYARETLQATIEELQTSNEELQAANEELIASNEELQSTNEELHSVNEELYTVNAEHQRRIVELRVLNGDMQHLLDGTDLGMLFLDHDLRVRRYTPRMTPVFHLEPADIGRSIRHFSHNLQRPALLTEIERALADGATIEDEVLTSDGTPYFMRILPYRPARGSDDDAAASAEGRGEGVVISLTDISALVRAQEHVRSLSMIVESSEDAIVSASLDGTITTWNGGASRLYGYAADDVIGRNLTILASDDAAPLVDGWLAAVGRGETLEHLDTLRRRKDGTLLDVSVSLSPLRDRTGAVVGVAAIARDVAPLRQAESELAARAARIRLLLDSTAEAIYGADLDGRCTFCNSACARTLGYAAVDEIIGRPVEAVLSHRPAETGVAAEHPARRVLQTGEGTHVVGELMVRADGTAFPAEYWSYPIRGDAGLLGAVVTFIDVTERQRAESEMREASRRREQFLAMLSHELRNPLAAVVNATHVLRRSTDDRLAVERASEVITRQTEHMSRLLDDLLDVARITRGGIELRKADIDFRRVIQLALEASSPMLEEHAVRLTVDVPPEPLPVRGDAARLQQVVGNIISNAVRYSDAGGAIHISARSDDGSISCRIRDTGRGIPASILDAIFDLFVQGEQDLDRRRGGLGVGLTLVRQIVKLHGGEVKAFSDGPGCGSEFLIELPRQERAILAKPERHLTADNAVSRRVVLAEDQEDSREMLRLLLEQLGHVVLEADDGVSALSAIERHHPDVALVDIGLPKMNGYDVARRLRRNPRFDDVLLVALTGYGTAEDVETARAAGFDEHMTKPSDFDRLTRVITRRREAVQ